MSDLRKTLQSKFQASNGFANFGEYIASIHIKGIRCHKDTIVYIKSPITAFCGVNGTGKSTILQLAAAAYKLPTSSRTQFSIRDFIFRGKLDPNPYELNASIAFQYAQASGTPKRLQLEYDSFSQRWSNYRSRPRRKVLFTGVGVYLPKIERRDYFVRNAGSVVISGTQPIDDRSKQWISRVLGIGYDHISSNSVSHGGKRGEVVSVSRNGAGYSESHMGYGEGRTQHMITALEALPDKSLVLIEEPETSLHPKAQHEFAYYLMDVCVTKGHQILLTTHSEFILQALPAFSRAYLARTQQGVKCVPGLSAMQATSLMTNGMHKALHILVEDDCAEAILTEILRFADLQLLNSVKVHIAGDCNVLAKTMHALKDAKINVAAVRDADFGDNPHENLFKLPGSQPPEKELFQNKAVREHLQNTYHLQLADFESSIADVDHHQWIERLADRISHTIPALTVELARIYAHSLPEVEVDTLAKLIREAIPR